MKDSYASINKIRRQVFVEVAKLAYDSNDYRDIEEIPYKMLKGEAKYRESIFLERAIVAERLRLAIGLPLRSADNHGLISDGIEKAIVSEAFYEAPLVNVIDFACNSCPDNQYYVSDVCVGCLANPCRNVCPKDAIKIVNHRSIIDQNKCIKCGKCMDVCPYNAIVHRERPCVKSCGMNAIESDDRGRAKINYDKCVSCGMCIVNCPFGAIADKSQLFQVIQAIKGNIEVYAIMSPAYVGQFGPKVNYRTIDDAMEKLGFSGVYDGAIGADICASLEADGFINDVPSNKSFVATSTCPGFSRMAQSEFPEFSHNISKIKTPMVLTARLVKKEHPNCKVVYVGPCSAKKLEAFKHADVDFVLTFEELMGMFVAKNVDFSTLRENEGGNDSSSDGRGFAVGGGSSQAISNAIKKLDMNRNFKVVSAQGLANCKNLLQMARDGRYDGYLIEGCACPSGCVGGAGTIIASYRTKTLVESYKKEAQFKNAFDSKYVEKK